MPNSTSSSAFIGFPVIRRLRPTMVRGFRPTFDHNPRHGGQFFMADDNWHHLEGTFIRPNVFRVYFYDDFTRPLTATTFSAAVGKAGNSPPAIRATTAGKSGGAKGRSTPQFGLPETQQPAKLPLC